MTEDTEGVSMIVNNFFAKDRKEVGEFAGMKIFIDENIPNDEIRFVKNGKIIKQIKFM